MQKDNTTLKACCFTSEKEINSPHFRGKLTLIYISNIEMLPHDTTKSVQI